MFSNGFLANNMRKMERTTSLTANINDVFTERVLYLYGGSIRGLPLETHRRLKRDTINDFKWPTAA